MEQLLEGLGKHPQIKSRSIPIPRLSLFFLHYAIHNYFLWLKLNKSKKYIEIRVYSKYQCLYLGVWDTKLAMKDQLLARGPRGWLTWVRLKALSALVVDSIFHSMSEIESWRTRGRLWAWRLPGNPKVSRKHSSCSEFEKWIWNVW